MFIYYYYYNIEAPEFGAWYFAKVWFTIQRPFCHVYSSRGFYAQNFPSYAFRNNIDSKNYLPILAEFDKSSTHILSISLKFFKLW